MSVGSLFLFRRGNRLRLRRATYFNTGVDERRWEVTFERGSVALGTGGSRSFTWATLKALGNTYRSAWRNRKLPRF